MSREMYEKLTTLKTKVEDAEPTVPDLRTRLEDINVDLQRIINLANSIPTATKQKPNPKQEAKAKQTHKQPPTKRQTSKKESKYMPWFKKHNAKNSKLTFQPEDDGKFLQYYKSGQEGIKNSLGHLFDDDGTIKMQWWPANEYPNGQREVEPFQSSYSPQHYLPARSVDGKGETFQYWNNSQSGWTDV